MKRQALIFSQLMAVAIWAIASAGHAIGLSPLGDQGLRFYVAGLHIANPYVIPLFVNPPWTAALLAPLRLVPFDISNLLQCCLTFGLLTLVIYRYGGHRRAVMVSLTSVFAFLSIAYLNIDWLVYLGLLLPPLVNAPLLLSKPQLALGIVVSYRIRTIAFWALAVGLLLIASFVLWGNWLPDMIAGVRYVTPLSSGVTRYVPYSLSAALGGVLLLFARARRDKALGIVGWAFCTPYSGVYSLILPFAMLAVKWPKAALVLSAAVWLAFIVAFWYS